MFYTCPVCDSKEFDTYNAEEKMFGMGNQFDYLECKECHSLRIKEIPDDLQLYYPKEYYAFKPKLKENFISVFLKNLRSKIWSLGIPFYTTDYYHWIKMVGVKKEDFVADIGCGNGLLLRQLEYCGFKNLYGFDPYIENEFESKNLKIFKKSINEIEGTYDLIMFHHSLEHMSDPAAVFTKVKSLLKPKGKVLIRVPITDGEIWKKERTNWFQLDAPRHLFIPSIQGMKILGEKVGLQLTEIKFDSLGNQFWGTELYKMGKSFNEADLDQIFSKKQLEDFETKAKEFNSLGLGDQAIFYFQL